MAALVETNVLVYRFDNRFPKKQKIAADILRRGIMEDSVRVPHQAIIELVAAVTRSIRGHVILERADACGRRKNFWGSSLCCIQITEICRDPLRPHARWS